MRWRVRNSKTSKVCESIRENCSGVRIGDKTDGAVDERDELSCVAGGAADEVRGLYDGRIVILRGLF